MDTILITNDSWRAQAAQQAGVDRVMVDLEIIGKRERQKNLDSLISEHCLSDVSRLRSVLKRTLLMVRVNPIHDHTRDEVDACTAAGADVLMLPMINHPAEARAFVETVGGRAKTCLLLETGAALARLPDIISVPGIDEVHLGLNDLHLSLKLDFMFETLSGGLIEYMARTIQAAGIRFGIGGIARFGQGLVSPELILSEHVRLGSSQVILSRDYSQLFESRDQDSTVEALRREIDQLQRCEQEIRRLGPRVQADNCQSLRRAVDEVVRKRRRGAAVGS